MPTERYEYGGLLFEWDVDKARLNLARHRVSFKEAATTFLDPGQVVEPDREHSHLEPRWLLLGRSRIGRLLLTAYTERVGHSRLISARPATRRERTTYEQPSRP